MTSIDATAATQSQSEKTYLENQHHFFELAPEIRNQIYHYLFQNQKIIIREAEFKLIWKHDEVKRVPNFERNRSLGLNMLFTSKRVHAEAKPVLMGSAVFDLDHWTMCRQGPRKAFRDADMHMVRSLTVSSEPFMALRALVHVMPKLSSITVTDDVADQAIIWGLEKQLATVALNGAQSLPGVVELVHAWGKYAQRIFKGFEQNAARSRKADGLSSFVIKMRQRHINPTRASHAHADPATRLAIIQESDLCYELVSGTAWMEENGKQVSTKVKAQGLTAYLESQVRLKHLS